MARIARAFSALSPTVRKRGYPSMISWTRAIFLPSALFVVMEIGICTEPRAGMMTFVMSTVVQVHVGCAFMIRTGRSEVLTRVTSDSRVLPGSTMPKSTICGVATIGG